jgi:hypothetical protein
MDVCLAVTTMISSPFYLAPAPRHQELMTGTSLRFPFTLCVHYIRTVVRCNEYHVSRISVLLLYCLFNLVFKCVTEPLVISFRPHVVEVWLN